MPVDLSPAEKSRPRRRPPPAPLRAPLARPLPATRSIGDLTPANLRYRPPLHHPEFPFVIFWSEKAACTTIVKWFFLQVGLLDQALAFNSWVHDYENKIYKAQAGYYEALQARLRAGVPCIKFVRDPYARAYSGYLELSRPLVLAGEAHWARKARAQLLADLIGTSAELEYAFSFRTYLRWLATRDMNGLDNHLREQYVPRDEFFDMKVLQIEELAAVFSMLEDEYGLPQQADVHRSLFESNHHQPKSDAFTAEQSSRLLEFAIPIRKAPDFKIATFDRRAARNTDFDAMVKASFRRDIDLYGYGK
jgi:hypothetical protein